MRLQPVCLVAAWYGFAVAPRRTSTLAAATKHMPLSHAILPPGQPFQLVLVLACTETQSAQAGSGAGRGGASQLLFVKVGVVSRLLAVAARSNAIFSSYSYSIACVSIYRCLCFFQALLNLPHRAV